MTRQGKIKRDAKALKEYKKRLERQRKVYHQTFELVAINNRRSREAALGACMLKALDAVRGLNRTKVLIQGSLYFNVNEIPKLDPEGRKGFHEIITYNVMSNEDAYTKEEIEKEIEETFEKMMRETDEMFPPEEEKKDAEEKDCHPGN